MKRWTVERVNVPPTTVDADTFIRVMFVLEDLGLPKGEVAVFTGQIAGKTVTIAMGNVADATGREITA